MIKPVLKYCIPIYLVLGCVSMGMLRRGWIPLMDLLEGFLGLLLMIAIVTVLGLFFGMVISVVIRKPNHERKFYWLGQLISFALIAIPLTQAILDSNPPKRSIAEQNEITIREVTDTFSRQFVVPAFDSLKSKFKNPNDLNLNSVTTIEHDGGFSVYFAYNLFDNKTKEYYSKYEVKNDQIQLAQFNLDTHSTREYLHIQKRQEGLKDTLNALESMAK